MSGIASTKAELRRELLANRQGIPLEVRREAEQLIGSRLLAWWNTNPVATLGVYWPIRGEPDLRGTYDMLTGEGVQLSLPVVVDKSSALRFIAWRPGDPMTRDEFGVAIPASGDVVKPEAVLVPCVGFNAQRYRLGYGGGFYDRTLAQSPSPTAVGVAFASALVGFEADAYDIALDAVITEAFQL